MQLPKNDENPTFDEELCRRFRVFSNPNRIGEIRVTQGLLGTERREVRVVGRMYSWKCLSKGKMSREE